MTKKNNESTGENKSYLKGMETQKITEGGRVFLVSRYVSPYTSLKMYRERECT